MAAVALWPYSAEIWFRTRANPDRLWSAGICIFTGGAVKENGVQFV